MKDGLDMTALREVKFLQELHHPNIISVSLSAPLHTLYLTHLTDITVTGRFLGQAECKPGSRIPRYRPGSSHPRQVARLPDRRYQELVSDVS